MKRNKLIEEIREMVVRFDEEGIKKVAYQVLEAGIDPLDVIKEGLQKGMDIMGKKYEKLEVYLPELMMAADTAYAALNILLPKISVEAAKTLKRGKVVIGTIFGDIHDIGKNIVATLLRISGYEVHDLGSDVDTKLFIETAIKENAEIIAISCLLSPSMYYMRDVVQRLKDMGIRDNHYVIIGGAAVYPEWTEEIGADGWAKDAEGAVELCKRLLEKGKEVEKPLIIGAWR